MQNLTFNKFEISIEIDGQMVDYTELVPFPIKWSNLLDERLDEATISVLRTDVEIFHPMTRVRIYVFNENDPDNGHTLNMLVSQDRAAQKFIQGQYVWNHDLVLIEETKLLEGFVCRSQGYVNSLGRDYTKGAVTVTPTVQKTSGNYDMLQPNFVDIRTPMPIGKHTFPPLNEIMTTAGTQYSLVEEYQGNRTCYAFVKKSDSSEPIAYTPFINEPLYATFDGSGIYDVTYQMMFRIGSSQQFVTGFIRYELYVIDNLDPLPKWNARTVIERALAIAEPLRKGDTPRFKLNAEQAAKFEKIETPEFQFTQSTLREVLQGIGAYIHGEPRLIGDTIYYDMYGSDELNSVKYQKYAKLSASQSIEDYATALDSTVDNFVNTLDTPYATMTEPYKGGYKTVRTEKTFARIEEGNMFIETKYPVYSIKKVMCGYTANSQPVDISPYIFESSEYARMSSYKEQFPECKAYALYYTQGDKNIQGLTFKVSDASGGVFKNYAILNILRAVTGNNNLSVSDYVQLAFQVEYTPIFPARVQQSKPYIGEFRLPRTLVYNQGQNVVESQYYGENMKGAIARLGNVDKVYTYVIYGVAELPKVGDLWNDDYYISAVSVQIDFQTTTVTIELSQDFNRYSQYLGINSTKRFYEVSERQAFDSQLSYRDYAVIGDKVDGGDTLYDIRGLNDTFWQIGLQTPTSLLIAQGEGASGEKLSKIALPVQTIALGNSAVLTTKYEDNYSAGNDSIKQESGNVKGQFTNAVSYGDFYGNIEYLYLDYFSRGTSPSDFENQTLIGNSLPSAEKISGESTKYISTGEKPLWVKKGSTEILSLTYQIDFVTNRRNIIIGSAMAKNCPFISGRQIGHYAELYVLPKRLNKFKLKADLTDATLVKSYTWESSLGAITVEGNSLVFAPVTSPVSGQAWVMVDELTHEILFGCNKEITPESEDILDGLYISGKHKLF